MRIARPFWLFLVLGFGITGTILFFFAQNGAQPFNRAEIVPSSDLPVVEWADVSPYPALLSAFRTPLLGGDQGRAENIILSAERIDGIEVLPGAEFSFNAVVGPRDTASGFLPAPEIYNGEFVMGVGGGVCQVSSTLYNAALLAGLEVLERAHHARPLAYVPLGRDATVAYGEVDFRFRNSLPFALQLRTIVTAEGQMEVQVWGQERLPFSVQIETLGEEVLMPDLEIYEDEALAAGEERLEEEGLPGWRVEVHRIVEVGATKHRQVISYDDYPSRPERIRIAKH